MFQKEGMMLLAKNLAFTNLNNINEDEIKDYARRNIIDRKKLTKETKDNYRRKGDKITEVLHTHIDEYFENGIYQLPLELTLLWSLLLANPDDTDGKVLLKELKGSAQKELSPELINLIAKGLKVAMAQQLVLTEDNEERNELEKFDLDEMISQQTEELKAIYKLNKAIKDSESKIKKALKEKYFNTLGAPNQYVLGENRKRNNDRIEKLYPLKDISIENQKEMVEKFTEEILNKIENFSY